MTPDVTPKQLRIFRDGHDMGVTAGTQVWSGPILVERGKVFGTLSGAERRTPSYFLEISGPLGLGAGEYSLREESLGVNIAINPNRVDMLRRVDTDTGTETTIYHLHFFSR